MKVSSLHIALLSSVFVIFVGIMIFVIGSRNTMFENRFVENASADTTESIDSQVAYDGFEIDSLQSDLAFAAEPCTVTVAAGSSIQTALDAAGTTQNQSISPYVVCVQGDHTESIVTTRDNLIIRGIGNPVLRQGGQNKIVYIKHNNVTLEDFTIDGLVSGQPADNKLIWMEKTSGSIIRHNQLLNGGGECIRILSNSKQNEILYNDILGCGVFKFGPTKNGEGIYIGLDPEELSTSAGWQKYAVGYRVACPSGSTVCFDDTGSNNIHHNRIQPAYTAFPDKGNECVDVKEGSMHNVILYNSCTGQMDSSSGAFDTRSSYNEFSHNTVLQTGTVLGAALRIGAENKNAAKPDGSLISLYPWKAEQNIVVKNELLNYSYAVAVKLSNATAGLTQARSCGNTIKSGGTFSSNATLISNPSCSPDDGTLPGIGGECVGFGCSGALPSPTETITPQATQPPSPTTPLATSTLPPISTPIVTTTPNNTSIPTPDTQVSGKVPTIITITSPKDSRVELSWTAVVDAKKYRIYISRPDKKKLYYEKSTSKVSAKFDLKSCKKYYFAVSAVDKNNHESKLSKPRSILVSIGSPVHACPK